MWHPFLGMDGQLLAWMFGALAVMSVLLMLRLETSGRRLRTASAPLGLVSLGMSLSPEESSQIIGSWSDERRDEARRHLATDYWLIPAYTTALAILGVLAARWFAIKGLHGMSALSVTLAWGQWFIGLLDFAEDSALLRILQTYPEISDGMTRLTSAFSRFKVLLILMAVIATIFVAATMLVPSVTRP